MVKPTKKNGALQMSFRLISLICATSFGLCACEDEQIRVYQAPKDTPPPAKIRQLMNPTVRSRHHDFASERATPSKEPIWSAPDHWLAQPGSGLRLATFLIGPPSQQAELKIIPLPNTPESRSPIANVTRWRRLMGLPVASNQQMEQSVNKISVAGHRASRVDLLGPPDDQQARQRRVVVILPMPDRVWFFDLIGPATTIEVESDSLQQFLASIKFDAPKAPITFNAPDNWQMHQTPQPPRQVAFTVNDGMHQGEIAVVMFTGNVGTALDNINRWRKQVGLTAIDNDEKQPIELIETVNAAGNLLDLIGPRTERSHPQRMLVAVIGHGDNVWFFKMMGPDPLIQKEKPRFVSFVQSTHFTR